MEEVMTKEKDKYENEIVDIKKKHRNKVNELKCHILQLQHQLSLQQAASDSPSLKRSSWTEGDINDMKPGEVLTAVSTPSSPTGISSQRRTLVRNAARRRHFSLERKYILEQLLHILG